MKPIASSYHIIEGRYYLSYESSDSDSKEMRIVRCDELKMNSTLNIAGFGTSVYYLRCSRGRWEAEEYTISFLDHNLGEVQINPMFADVFELTDDEVLKHLVAEQI